MRIAVFGTKAYDRQFLDAANGRFDHRLTYFEPRLDLATVVLAKGFPAVCVFVNDCLADDHTTIRPNHGSGSMAMANQSIRHRSCTFLSPL